MTHTFDTLGYANHLEQAGIARKHAEAHAEAAKRFILQDMATKQDLELQTAQLTIRLGSITTAIVGGFLLLQSLFTG